MSRQVAMLALFLFASTRPALAQTDNSPPERIDILAPQRVGEVEVEECTEDQEAAIISGEIVVCRRFKEESTDGVWNKEDWENRYAARTQGEKPVDVTGPGIFRGPATVSGLCLIPPCPKPPALIIDVEALPEAPPGSDADRIARGLSPRGIDVAAPDPSRDVRASRGDELGLPPLPDFAENEDAEVSPAGSEAPEERP